ncbi:MAG: pantetheine-phosphate adenylyltransferase [Woeseiaceae bacterium]|jgi:pantetheine-phosphate adenylyltransferase|nr:pantetheine-phosphate adenylyltransferase [Woeseiaceae bacterium]|tara:strand:- start:1226 stop:1714 length:489 start_codon:yes stop_codon:yes gene_type:complete
MTVNAMYPGTFDPMTLGHKELAIRASKIFDKVVVAIAANPEKNPMFTLKERVDMAKSVLKDLKNVEVCDYSGLTVDFAMAHDIRVIVRGLRAVSDFEYELQLANMNRYLAKEIETAFLTPTEYAFITSSLVREVATMGGNVSSFVAPVVEKILTDRFNKSKN